MLNFACRRLNLRFEGNDALPYWLLVLPSGSTAECADTLVRVAVLAYAVYRATNTLRPLMQTQAQRDAIDISSDDSSSDDSSLDGSGSDDTGSDDRNYGPSEPRAIAERTDVREPVLSDVGVCDLLTQLVYEAVSGHAGATKVIDTCWASSARGNPRMRLG